MDNNYLEGMILRTYSTSVFRCTLDCFLFEYENPVGCGFWSFQKSTLLCTLFQIGTVVERIDNTDYFSGTRACFTV